MKKILAFSGSMSARSINHSLIEYTAKLLPDHAVQLIRLSDFPAPLYTKEVEETTGIPKGIRQLRELFDAADGFLLSTPEYNSSIPGGLKNTIDWLSRMEGKVFQDKPVLLMAASPGGRGGRSVLDHLGVVMPFWGARVAATFSLPRFHENMTDGVLHPERHAELQEAIRGFEAGLG